MAFFGFGKKKEEKEAKGGCCCNAPKEEVKETKSPCCCSCSPKEDEAVQEKCCCGKERDGICCIKVLGAGCKSCHTQFENAKEAVKNLGLDIEVEYITDMEKIMSYVVMSMPAIVVNDKVVSFGKVLTPAAIEELPGK